MLFIKLHPVVSKVSGFKWPFRGGVLRKPSIWLHSQSRGMDVCLLEFQSSPPKNKCHLPLYIYLAIKRFKATLHSSLTESVRRQVRKLLYDLSIVYFVPNTYYLNVHSPLLCISTYLPNLNNYSCIERLPSPPFNAPA